MTSPIVTLETERLILRGWKADDFPVFAAMTADPAVMRYFPHCLSEDESNALASRIQGLLLERGWGFWAVERKDSGEYIGFVGLHTQDETVAIPNTPLVEIGWRLSAAHWQQGFASEAAQAALAFAFDTLQQPEVYAFTILSNTPSRKVMEKIGMSNTGEDFDHPKLLSYPDTVKRHCLYRITQAEWANKSQVNGM
ncbi:GNAT family N-acetyltransferase [Photobacterium aphoticum]|uniref:GCN5 family acetyltransferase n=1 Tax=Photobacterium aphoticum TaxID=754436 RepID=A0A0J1GMB6_9GAMM|nr:GNAT family N-acetyltransferase [Photobacterium aphoticum]KLV00888.1 GCN5 family acetyltransferase [Photobacterium aphoticum]PSU58943.1 N-acetyltransferase [Photobacterium aphoticum]GHA57743.1 N-acetyltransferase [Photobacterium aphoticum]